MVSGDSLLTTAFIHLPFCHCELFDTMDKQEYGRIGLEVLPYEVQDKIMKYLPMVAIVRSSRVNKYFYELCNEDQLWEELYERDLGFPKFERKPKDMKARDFYKRVYRPDLVLWRFVNCFI